MNKTEFLSFIEHPENIGSVSLAESEKVLGKFPYWQSARLIFVKALQQQQHFSYDSQLKLAAIYAGNRSKLFELINKGESEAERESVSNSQREGSQLEVDNQTNEIENDLITIEKIEEPSNIEDSIETGDENIIVTENFFSENIAILTTESNVEEQIETSDEKNITTEYSFSENVEMLTDEKEENINESENDLSKIIEQRIKELTEQNSSYCVTESHDSVTENAFENTALLNDENIPSEIENDTSDKNSFEDDTVSIEEEMAAIDVYEETTIANDVFNSTAVEVVYETEIIEEIIIENDLNNKNSFEDESVSIEEKMAAIDVYEETTIADDVFTSTATEVVSSPETIEEIVNESDVNAKTDSSHHTFLDWFRFLKPGDDKSGSSTEQSKEGVKIIEDDSFTPIKENPTPESATPIIVSEESETLNTIPDSSSGKQKNSIEIESETRNPKPETSNLKPQTSNLIDKFIEEDPRIQPKKSAFFSPSVAARKSVEYDDEVVSETLAEIFYMQQVYDKALKAYEKLTLMFPEKSTLFAARIKKIKEESKSGK